MNIEAVKELLYNKAINNEFTRSFVVLGFLNTLNKTEQEILMESYWGGFKEGAKQVAERNDYLQKFLAWFEKEGYTVQCQYDANRLINSYEEYLTEQKSTTI